MKNKIEFSGTDELKPRGFFVTGSDEEYPCIFFANRKCHVREYVGITDENLRKETVTTATERETRTIADVPSEPVVRKYHVNTAHWLVNEFCRICPHREA